MMSLRNPYLQPFPVEVIQKMTLRADLCVFSPIRLQDLDEGRTRGGILTAGNTDATTGILMWRLVASGCDFELTFPNSVPGDIFFLCHIPGDGMDKYFFVQKDEVLGRYDMQSLVQPEELPESPAERPGVDRILGMFPSQANRLT